MAYFNKPLPEVKLPRVLTAIREARKKKDEAAQKERKLKAYEEDVRLRKETFLRERAIETIEEARKRKAAEAKKARIETGAKEADAAIKVKADKLKDLTNLESFNDFQEYLKTIDPAQVENFHRVFGTGDIKNDKDFESFKENATKTSKGLLDKFSAVQLNLGKKGVRTLKNVSKGMYHSLVNEYGKENVTIGEPEKKEKGKSSFGKMVDEYLALPKGHPARQIYEQKFAGKGWKMTSDGKGGFTIEQVPVSGKKTKTLDEHILAAMKGDKESQQFLAAKLEYSGELAEYNATGKVGGLLKLFVKTSAKSVLDGREIIDNVKNTFGVPVQEMVRAEVLKQEPNFNFNKPRAIFASLKSSLTQQQKNRGAMGSFVKNINKQVTRLEEISKDIVSRVGIRGLDVPIRAFKTTFLGRGHENVYSGYMKEVSNEINKLTQGSQASIAQLSEEGQRLWDKIHDPNLSYKEIMKVLEGTKEMANLRMESVDEEIAYTIEQLENVNFRTGEARKLTPEIAKKYLDKNKGDRKAAEKEARKDGYEW